MDPCKLVENENYVACGSEKFKHGAYGTKGTHKHGLVKD